MAKVTPETMQPVHVRAARALLNMSTRELAEAVGDPVSHDKVRNFENGKPASAKVRGALLDAFSAYGLSLKNGGKPGAHVDDVEAWKCARKPDASQKE